ncbi:MAG TPA: GNAT family N-acetyltransferase [Terriglobales bacterium]|nr:GNAT family N-acetyltransferase [Terriglobales bacterium]
MWKIFDRKPQDKHLVTKGRFEIEQDGETAFLEYTLSGHVLTLLHTKVPEKLRHHGLGVALAAHGFKWARENNLKVDVVCPIAEEYLAKHPEYSDLVVL